LVYFYFKNFAIFFDYSLFLDKFFFSDVSFSYSFSNVFLNSFSRFSQEICYLDFFEDISFSSVTNSFFLGLDHSQLQITDDYLSLFNKFFFSTFYNTMYFDSFIVEDIPFKSFYERQFKYIDFDIIARSKQFDDYFYSCSFVDEYFDFFQDIFYTTYVDYDLFSRGLDIADEFFFFDSLELVDLFKKSPDSITLSSMFLSNSLSFNEFLFIENIQSFEDFFTKYCFIYRNIFNDFSLFFNKITFFFDFFKISFLPFEKNFFGHQDIIELLLFSQKFYDTLFSLYTADSFFINLLDFLLYTELFTNVNAFFIFLGHSIFFLEDFIDFLKFFSSWDVFFLDPFSFYQLECKFSFFFFEFFNFSSEMDLFFFSIDFLFYNKFFQYESSFINNHATLFYFKKDLFAHAYSPITIRK